MKKLLSLALALMLIIGVLPTAFANTADEPQEVTYLFYPNGHSSGATTDRMEAADGTKNYTALQWNESGYGAWAYLGCTTKTTYNSTDTKRIVLTSDTGTYCYFTLDPDTYIAYKIQVPKTGTYKIEDYSPYLIKNSTATDIKMYIVPMTQDLAANLKADDGRAWTSDPTKKGKNRQDPLSLDALGITASPLGTYSAYTADTQITSVDASDFGTVDMEANSDYVLILHSAIGGRTGISSLTLKEVVPESKVQFVIPEGGYKTYNEGKVQLTSKLIASDGTTDITNLATVSYESNNNYATVNDSGLVTGVSAGTAVITATYTYNGKTYSEDVEVVIEKANKSHTYTLNMTKLSDSALEKAGITKTVDGSTTTYYKDGVELNNLKELNCVSDYADIADVNSWCIATDLYSDEDMDLHASYWRIIARKGNYLTDNGGNLGALKIKVEYTGTYTLAARMARSLQGAEADVYAVPVADAPKAITQAYLKTLAPIGRISCIGSGNQNISISNVYLAEGDYYLIFNLYSDNLSTIAEGGQYFMVRYISLTENSDTTADPNAPQDTLVSAPTIAVTSNLPNPSFEIITADYAGASITLSVEEREGFRFVGWKKGVKTDSNVEIDGTSKFVELQDNGDGTYSYTAWTNAYLTAVYEEVNGNADEKVVRFWSRDGLYLGDKTIAGLDAENELPTTTLIGYDFREWWTSENVTLTKEKLSNLTAAVTNAVAQFDAKQTVGTVDFDAVKVNGITKNNVCYGEEVECIDANPTKVTHWLRDGKVVSYDSTYKYYVWDGTNICSSYAPIEKKPLVVLDANSVDGAWMIEYDKGNADAIVEVGILFGNGSQIISSATSRYTSQRNDSHGQFTAKGEGVARGYMIYKDGAEYKVIYSE